ncbi:inositol-tetrakisphosphate 1-kinase [Engraulis encrasicolus]|uniref:inositol-tetrakisphosphate 1-kinase n=1 Tax=Engraulis encrasicolus TaxID=184585 RepID=UPI002FD024A2
MQTLTLVRGRRVGFWLSEKKMKKLNFTAFTEMCRRRGIELVQLDLCRPLEDQGPLDAIIHKLTDLMLDNTHTHSLQRVQDYIDAHPSLVVLDPLPAIRTLLDRCKSYQLVQTIEEHMQDERICSPPFMLLEEPCGPNTLEKIHSHGLTFPLICKTRVAHGTNSHEMAIIFSEEGLSAVRPPCVCQSFINHNAVLHKVFVIGDTHTVVQRPSLKNFPQGPTDRESIFFNSHNVSKPESSSDLTSREHVEGVSSPPCDDVIGALCRALRCMLGVSLFGIDVIINNQSGQHAVIDINAFPGYEGVPEFFSELLNHISCVLQTPPTSGQAPPLLPPTTMALPTSPSATEEEAEPVKRLCLTHTHAHTHAHAHTHSHTHTHSHSSAIPPNFQQHCVASLATKASSQ